MVAVSQPLEPSGVQELQREAFSTAAVDVGRAGGWRGVAAVEQGGKTERQEIPDHHLGTVYRGTKSLDEAKTTHAENHLLLFIPASSFCRGPGSREEGIKTPA